MVVVIDVVVVAHYLTCREEEGNNTQRIQSVSLPMSSVPFRSRRVFWTGKTFSQGTVVDDDVDGVSALGSSGNVIAAKYGSRCSRLYRRARRSSPR